MPGLAGVIGVPDARSVLDRLIAALQHRPGYVTTIHTGTGSAVARIARPEPVSPGPSGPCLMHGSPGTAPDGTPAPDWIDRCLDDGRPERISQLEGSFHTCRDTADGVSLVTDRFGQHPLYLAPFQGGFAFAPEVQALAGLPGFDASLDDLAIRQLLEHGHVFDRRTLFSTVELLPPGTVTRLTTDGPHHQTYYRFDPPPVSPDLGPTELGEAIESGVRSALRRAAGHRRLGCMLSGGLDSRTVTAEAVALGANPLAITFGSPDSADVKLAVRVAKILDLEHLVIQLDARSVADSIEEAVLVTGGTTSAAHLTGHASNRQLADAVDVVLSGMAGDGITGKVPPDLPAIPQKAIHPLLPTQSIIMPEAFRAATGEPYEQSLEVDIAAYPEGTSPIIISTFEALRCRWRRFTLSGVVSRRLDTSVQFPFFRQQLLDTAFALAPEQRLHQAAYAANFTSRHPRCAAVPWERTGRPISRGARQPSLAFRMARGLRARIAAALKGGRVARQTGHFDYAAELRRPGPLREMIADLLTDGTASTRPWLDADGVSRLLERHFAGMANNLAPLARALTLELFLRRVRQPAVPDSA